MKMEQTEGSETSAYKIQTTDNYPEESIQNSEQGGSVKSRLYYVFVIYKWTVVLKFNVLVWTEGSELYWYMYTNCDLKSFV